MGKCIVNPSGVLFNGGETKDAKPPGWEVGTEGAAGRDDWLQFCFFLQMIFFRWFGFFFGCSLSEALLEGIFG